MLALPFRATTSASSKRSRALNKCGADSGLKPMPSKRLQAGLVVRDKVANAGRVAGPARVCIVVPDSKSGYIRRLRLEPHGVRELVGLVRWGSAGAPNVPSPKVCSLCHFSVSFLAAWGDLGGDCAWGGAGPDRARQMRPLGNVWVNGADVRQRTGRTGCATRRMVSGNVQLKIKDSDSESFVGFVKQAPLRMLSCAGCRTNMGGLAGCRLAVWSRDDAF